MFNFCTPEKVDGATPIAEVISQDGRDQSNVPVATEHAHLESMPSSVSVVAVEEECKHVKNNKKENKNSEQKNTEGGYLESMPSSVSVVAVEEERKRAFMQNMNLAPSKAAWHGPHVGDEREPAETYREEIRIRDRANSHVSMKVDETHTPTGYESPLAGQVGPRPTPKTPTPYKEFESYVPHPHDEVESYEAALHHGAAKKEQFHRDHSGDLRVKAVNKHAHPSKKEEHCRDHAVQHTEHSERYGPKDFIDKHIEDFYHHKNEKERAPVDEDYQARREGVKVNQVEFPKTVYQKKVARELKAQEKSFSSHKVGQALHGHDSDSEGEEAAWARGS